MDGTTLWDAFEAFVSRARIDELARELAVVERVRKFDVPALVWALVVGAGSDDSGVFATPLPAQGWRAPLGTPPGWRPTDPALGAWHASGLAPYGPGAGRSARLRAGALRTRRWALGHL